MYPVKPWRYISSPDRPYMFLTKQNRNSSDTKQSMREKDLLMYLTDYGMEWMGRKMRWCANKNEQNLVKAINDRPSGV